jgi:heme exporter protein C
MGMVYKIYYYHMPSAWMFLLAPLVCGFSSALFLMRGRAEDDRRAWAAAELTVLFGALTLLTGPLWARRAWGTWWVWDARLTSSLVGWMIGWAYLILRRYGGPGSDKLAAGVALFGAVNVPFIYISVNYWRTIHPPTTVVPRLPVSMGLPLWFCVFAFLLLFVLLMTMRLRLEHARTRLDALYVALDE